MKIKDGELFALFIIMLILSALMVVLFPSTAQASGYEHDLDEVSMMTARELLECDDCQVMIPRLVGYDCVGSSGPLFANEEDHFPRCKTIEAWR